VSDIALTSDDITTLRRLNQSRTRELEKAEMQAGARMPEFISNANQRRNR
jgi:hypothetical protein